MLMTHVTIRVGIVRRRCVHHEVRRLYCVDAVKNGPKIVGPRVDYMRLRRQWRRRRLRLVLQLLLLLLLLNL